MMMMIMDYNLMYSYCAQLFGNEQYKEAAIMAATSPKVSHLCVCVCACVCVCVCVRVCACVCVCVCVTQFIAY